MHIRQEQNSGQDHQSYRFLRTKSRLYGVLYKHTGLIVENGRWRLLGYFAVLPMLAIIFFLTLSLQHLVNNFALVDGVLVLAVSIIAFLWGCGPALLLVLFGMIMLDLWFIPPYGQLSLTRWPNVLQVLPFCLAGMIIGLLSFQQTKGWFNAQATAHALTVANQKLEDEAQLRERFLSMTSHELKTPITRIALQSQLMQRRLKQYAPMSDVDSVVRDLRKIDQQTQFLANMIDELLDFSRIQHRAMALQQELVDINELCRHAVEDLHVITGRTLLFHGSAPSTTVYGDPHRLTQIVSNLITNAVKYSSPPSPIGVTVERDTHEVRILVHDDGPGIEQDHLDHIFDAFYHTPAAQSSIVEGLGLGLAISKQIIDLHEGHIWCVSEQGQGTTFFVALPLPSESSGQA